MNAVTHPVGRGRGEAPLDVARVRLDFPILARSVNGQPLAYLDNAASSQRPQSVIDAISHYYEHSHANVHRGVHALSQEATDLFEGARRRVQHFINAGTPREIVFVRGTTEAINLVAQSWGRPALRQGDEILISHLEHHANIVPWQLLCEQTGARLRVIPMTRAARSTSTPTRACCPTARACGAGARLELRSGRSCPCVASSPKRAGVASRCCSTERRRCRT
jgi:selenocysteine lyase/cysteine desulfurase